MFGHACLFKRFMLGMFAHELDGLSSTLAKLTKILNNWYMAAQIIESPDYLYSEREKYQRLIRAWKPLRHVMKMTGVSTDELPAAFCMSNDETLELHVLSLPAVEINVATPEAKNGKMATLRFYPAILMSENRDERQGKCGKVYWYCLASWGMPPTLWSPLDLTLLLTVVSVGAASQVVVNQELYKSVGGKLD